ncbi:hypothetical protein Q7P37_010194 [Cladosporium fusiforme]
MADDNLTTCPDNNETISLAKGNPSKIHDYCTNPQRQAKSCIWLCRKEGRSFFAWDVPIEDVENCFLTLHSSRWWSRFAFYDYVGARHIKLLRTKKESRGFPVIVKNVNHGEQITHMRQFLDGVELRDPHGCGVDKNGRRHAVDEQFCENQVMDDMGSMYCKALNYAQEENRMHKWTWMPEMLDYFWRHGVERDGLDFLQSSGFLLSYESLAYETYFDAEDPYGKSIDAFELVRGWRVRRLLWTTIAAIVIDICIVAVVTLLSGSGETGLAAGSYAAAVEALMMALLTLLNAVIT